MTQRYAPGLFDRLLGEDVRRGHSIEQLKDSIARDLEALLNTRTALSDDVLAPYPHAARSLLSYGLVDFAGLCLTSDVDQKRICAAVQRAIERHEPRLANVRAALRTGQGGINRIDFVISATLKADRAAEAVQFDAVLTQSTQQYCVRRLRTAG